MGMTRRDFLMRVGQVGGYNAAFLTMQGLGLVEASGSTPEFVRAETGSGNCTKVVILGGGIAGLVAAYEFRSLGYQCTVLEARLRGSELTVRFRPDPEVWPK